MNAGPGNIETVDIFEMSISKLDFEGVCMHIAARIARNEPGFIVTPNVDHVCNYHRLPHFRKAYNNAYLVLPDGMPILWAARLFGDPLPQKLSGSDMVPRLCEFAEAEGYSVFFFGGSRGSAEEAIEKMQSRHPRLKIAGSYCPPYGFEKDPVEDQKAADAVRAANPDICFVALGSPKQELWMNRHCAAIGTPAAIGVGGSFELVSGRVRRAPSWVQDIGMEWLWRLAHEPRRLWHRYLVDDLIFFKLLWDEFRKKRTAQSTLPMG